MSTSLTIVLNLEALEHRRRDASLSTDSQLARFIGVDPATVSRVISGRSAPGTKFIAGMVRAFGSDAFADLFAIRDESAGSRVTGGSAERRLPEPPSPIPFPRSPETDPLPARANPQQPARSSSTAPIHRIGRDGETRWNG